MPRTKPQDAKRQAQQSSYEIDAMAAPFRRRGAQDCRDGLPCLAPPDLHTNPQRQDWWVEGYMAEYKRRQEAAKVAS